MSTDTVKWNDKTPAQKLWVIVGFISIIPIVIGFLYVKDHINDTTSQSAYSSTQTDTQATSAPYKSACEQARGAAEGERLIYNEMLNGMNPQEAMSNAAAMDVSYSDYIQGLSVDLNEAAENLAIASAQVSQVCGQ